jgi:hypothetical protein
MLALVYVEVDEPIRSGAALDGDAWVGMAAGSGCFCPESGDVPVAAVFGDRDLALRWSGERALKLDETEERYLVAGERERDRILDEMASKKD